MYTENHSPSEWFSVYNKAARRAAHPAASPAQRVAAGSEEIPARVQFSAKPETERWREFLSWRNAARLLFPPQVKRGPRESARQLSWGKEEQRNERTPAFCKKRRSKRYGACSDVAQREGFELLFEVKIL